MVRKEPNLKAGDDRLHPGVSLQLFDGDITQGVGVLPLATALRHAQEAVQVKGYNARQPHKPAYTGWASVLVGVANQSCIETCCSGQCCYCSVQNVCVTAAADVAEGCYCLATQGRAGQVLDESRQMLNVQCAEASQKYCMQRVQQSAQSR